VGSFNALKIKSENITPGACTIEPFTGVINEECLTVKGKQTYRQIH
jgi:hypothetical protein